MRKWFGNLLVVIGASIGTLLVLELALQFIYPIRDTWKFYSIPDPELGWVLQPGAEFTRAVPGALVDVRYNSEGFRDSEHPDPPPETATRIVVLGDSFMEANMVPLQDVFPKQLERLAASRGVKIATYNLGVAGYGTLQEYMTFRKAGVKRKPDIVLLAFFLHNDVRNNAEHLNAGAQALRSGKRKRPFLDESNDGEWNILPPDYDAMQAKFLRRRNSPWFWMKYNSSLLSLFRSAKRTFKSPSRAFRGGAALAMHVCGSGPQYEKAWRTTERILNRLKKEVLSAGARLIVFSVPSAFDADMSLVAQLDPGAKTGKSRFCVKNSPGYRRLSETLERSDIPYVDLVPAFRRAVTGEKRNLFVKGDWHWNGDGHALAAKTVYRLLEQEGLLGK